MAIALVGTNCDVIPRMDFLYCTVSWMRYKATCTAQKTIAIGRLLMMDCPKHSLKHYQLHVLPFGTVWVDEPSSFVVLGVGIVKLMPP